MNLSLSTHIRILIPTYLLEMARLRFSWLDLSPTYSAQFVADVNVWAAHFLEHWQDGKGWFRYRRPRRKTESSEYRPMPTQERLKPLFQSSDVRIYRKCTDRKSRRVPAAAQSGGRAGQQLTPRP
jgi:hypothetical protein